MNLKTYLKSNSPHIMTALGVVGFGLAVVSAVKARPKAKAVLDAYYKEGRPEKLTPKEVAKEARMVFGIYSRAIGLFSVSTGLVMGSDVVMARRYADLSILYSLTENLSRSFRESAAEVVGHKKYEEIQAGAIDRRIREVTSGEDIVVPENHSLFFDVLSGRYFVLRRVEDLREIVVTLNEHLFADDYVPINSYFYEIGLENTFHGDSIGWIREKGQIELSYTSRLTKNNRPCVAVSFVRMPDVEYDRL